MIGFPRSRTARNPIRMGRAPSRTVGYVDTWANASEQMHRAIGINCSNREIELGEFALFEHAAKAVHEYGLRQNALKQFA